MTYITNKREPNSDWLKCSKMHWFNWKLLTRNLNPYISLILKLEVRCNRSSGLLHAIIHGCGGGREITSKRIPRNKNNFSRHTLVDLSLLHFIQIWSCQFLDQSVPKGWSYPLIIKFQNLEWATGQINDVSIYGDKEHWRGNRFVGRIWVLFWT